MRYRARYRKEGYATNFGTLFDAANPMDALSKAKLAPPDWDVYEIEGFNYNLDWVVVWHAKNNGE